MARANNSFPVPLSPRSKNSGVGGGDFLNLLADFADGRVFTEDAWEAVARRIFFAEDEDFREAIPVGGRAADEEFQVLEVDGLLEKIESAFLHGSDGFVDGAVGGEEQHGHGGVGLLGSRSTSRPEAPGIFRSVMTRR